MNSEVKTLGQIAFEAYREAVNNKTYDQREIPDWVNVSASVQAGWEAAAKAVAEVSLGSCNLTEDEYKVARDFLRGDIHYG